MKEFQSKKNKVYLTADKLVYKEYSNTEAFDKEVSTLKKVQSKYTPKLLSYDRNLRTAILSYTEGELLVDRFVAADKASAKELATLLTETVFYLHKMLGEFITYDENFKNYIVCDSKCVRIDFEECVEGTLESWCAKISAFASLYENSVEVKAEFIKVLAHGLKVNVAKFLSEYETELRTLAERWKVDFSDETFVAVSKKFKTK